MFDFYEKRKIRGVLYSKTVFVLLLFLAVLLSVSVYNRFIVAEETKAKLNDRNEDLEALEMRAETLQSKVDYLENERGIEEELRNRFDVAKEGEQVVIILDEKEKKIEKKRSEVPRDESIPNTGIKNFFQLLKFW